ncbi:DUF1153 domain-containing protein [Rhodobacteraceae bacterium CCMM004]|nr:DUF1153 domain-containing protein [Rhodobacteraceae bacterium CCMM004]
MYLKKVEGPRTVTLPNGKVLSQADLPPPDTQRWVASRKAAVVRAVASGLISRESALNRYGLSDEEFQGWAQAVAQHGEAGLKTTQLQKYRQL